MDTLSSLKCSIKNKQSAGRKRQRTKWQKMQEPKRSQVMVAAGWQATDDWMVDSRVCVCGTLEKHRRADEALRLTHKIQNYLAD